MLAIAGWENNKERTMNNQWWMRERSMREQPTLRRRHKRQGETRVNNESIRVDMERTPSKCFWLSLQRLLRMETEGWTSSETISLHRRSNAFSLLFDDVSYQSEGCVAIRLSVSPRFCLSEHRPRREMSKAHIFHFSANSFTELGPGIVFDLSSSLRLCLTSIRRPSTFAMLHDYLPRMTTRVNDGIITMVDRYDRMNWEKKTMEEMKRWLRTQHKSNIDKNARKHCLIAIEKDYWLKSLGRENNCDGWSNKVKSQLFPKKKNSSTDRRDDLEVVVEMGKRKVWLDQRIDC